MKKPNFDEEKILWKQGYKYIAGVDEVGRGCFAGPVVAAAVIMPQDFSASDEINDSKKLSPEKRIKLAKIIREYAMGFSISVISVEIINKFGIGEAAQMAFLKAIKLLTVRPDYILIDAFFIKNLERKIQKPIIHGDAKSISIAAASIIAKVYRDELMRKLHCRFPMYDFDNNMGYGTIKHRGALKKHGLSKFHRTSFKLEKFL